MSWTWDPNKNAENIRKHKIAFADVLPILDDPLSLVEPDETSYEFRLKTIGVINQTIYLVIHTPERDNLSPHPSQGRIISARKANARERIYYANKR